MELNQLAIKARRRNPWQVFDLSQLFVRQHWWAISKVYAAIALPIFVICWLVFPIEWAMWLVWLLKPAFERPMLDYLGKTSFSQPTTTWSCLTSFKQVNFGQLLLACTIYRLSPNRAYLAPVEQLEKQSGSAAQKRKQLLVHRCKHNQIGWITLCVHFEMLLLIGLITLVYTFIPEGITIDSQLSWESFTYSWLFDVYYLLYFFSLMLIAPFFVTGGFLMYLNSRIELEGWDIELAFKRIAGRVKQLSSQSGMVSSWIIAAIIISLSYLPSTPAMAQTGDSVELSKNEQLTPVQQKIRDNVASIYQDQELVVSETMWIPKFDDQVEPDLSWLDSLKGFFKALANISPILGYLMWGLVIALCCWVVYQIYLHAHLWFKPSSIKSVSSNNAAKKHFDAPNFLQPINNQSWPSNLLNAALDANQQQQTRLALTYLLRHALQLVDKQYPELLHPSMTEQECQRALAKLLPSETNSLYQSLLDCWCKQAWAHQVIEAQQILNLIEAFQQLTTGEQHES